MNYRDKNLYWDDGIWVWSLGRAWVDTCLVKDDVCVRDVFQIFLFHPCRNSNWVILDVSHCVD